MIYNGMHFMQIPLHIVVTDFRQKNMRFDRVEEAATAFLKYLNKRGQDCSDNVKMAALRAIVAPAIDRVRAERDAAFEKLIDEGIPPDLPDQFKRIQQEKAELILRALRMRKNASFIGRKLP
jgi:hypothetical protein